VLDPYRLVILFIAFIHIVCCLKIYFHQTIQMGFVFFLRIFQDKCNHDYNGDYLAYHVIAIDYIVILFNRN